MLKEIIIRSISKFNYPQVIFASAIVSYFRSSRTTVKDIVDCPCGMGETSYHLAKVNGVKILAADISEKSIELSKIHFQRPNIEFVQADIIDIIKRPGNVDVFCIINSLFLFSNASEMLRTLRQKLTSTNGKLLLIIPNTAGRNLAWFQQKYPGETKLVISYEDIKPFFDQFGFKTEYIKPLGYTHHFNRKDLRLFSVFVPIYLSFLNFFQTLFKIGKPNYFLVVLH